MNTRRWVAAGLLVLVLAALSGCFLFGNRNPEAAFTIIYDVDATDPLVVDLDASASSDPDGDNIVSYSWAFSDDMTIVSPQVYSTVGASEILRIRFPFEGTYTITLLVRDEAGNSSLPVMDTVIIPNVPVAPTQ